jgi:exopolyphosphatase/guanosine-5'-triphosphate,3'-diphosphate pyrophosphatase
VGAVRLTERHVRGDPPLADEVARLRAAAREAVRPFGAMDLRGGRLVAVAGTATTLAAVAQRLPVYDAEKVHGSPLALAEIERLAGTLAALTVRERAALPGMEPKRADVILAGAIVLAEAARAAGFERLTVSDRGVRWGLLYERAR